MDHAHKLPAGPLTRSCWVSSMSVESNAAMVGWTALVPVEAEEEWMPDASAIAPWPEPAPDPLPGKSRFVTRWEPA